MDAAGATYGVSYQFYALKYQYETIVLSVSLFKPIFTVICIDAIPLL
ncbi:MAG: hypothetical protein JWP37_743 [Mucilaginibacter sp.]|nr:hypothetical protein [Mucilaginibacter sp.]